MSDSAPIYSVLPALAADIPTIARLLCTSKLSLTINRLLYENWPNESIQLANSFDAVQGSFQSPTSEVFKVVENESGTIVGHLVLTHETPTSESREPQQGESSGKLKEERIVPEGMVPEILDLVGRAVKGACSSVQEVEHLVITHIYVTPLSRRRGIGKQLLQLCKERRIQAGIPLFVCSEPYARDFFLHSSFEEVGVADMELQHHAPSDSGFGNFRLSGMLYKDSADTEK